MKKIPFFVCMILFWLAACSPKTVQANPSPTVPPLTETLVPPTEESEFVTYQDTKNKFEITYSREIFTPDFDNSTPDLLVLVLDVGKLFSGKNLENVEVRVSASPVCVYQDLYTEDNQTGEETINDIDFLVYSTQDTETASNVFQTLTYQAHHNNLCYEIHLKMREYSLTEFPNVAEYDPEVLIIEFKNLLGTFKFIE
jgi:hypothetical protein